MRSTGAVIAGGVGVSIIGVVLLVTVIGWLGAFHGTDPGVVCVVQQGGPFDGRGIAQVRQGGGGVSNIGIWNHQRCFPATQRNYIVSSNPSLSDSKTVDNVLVPTKDAVNVHVEGQAIFTLNTGEKTVRDFYKKYGVRSFNGVSLGDNEQKWWENFLAIQFRPILENALREAIGQFDCVDLNNTCQYVTNAQEAVKGNIKQVQNSQNIAQAQTQIEAALQRDLNSTLGGPFFENVRFRFAGGQAITFEPQVQQQITAAQAKRTEVATAQLEANRAVAEAEGKKRVAQQVALAIQTKANAYKHNQIQGQIDLAHALCGDNGCPIQVIGGNGGVTKLLQTK